MRRDIPAIRIFPMSDQLKGFRGRSIEQVQTTCFLRDLPASNGRYRYRSAGLNAEPGTVVLFQFQARIIASAVFLRDEKTIDPKAGIAARCISRLDHSAHSIHSTPTPCAKSGRASGGSGM